MPFVLIFTEVFNRHSSAQCREVICFVSIVNKKFIYFCCAKFINNNERENRNNHLLSSNEISVDMETNIKHLL